MVPALCLMAGLGLTSSSEPVAGSVVCTSVATAGWLLHTQRTYPTWGIGPHSTDYRRRRGRTQMCSPDWIPQLYPWFREWRRPSNMNQHIRQRFGEWLEWTAKLSSKNYPPVHSSCWWTPIAAREMWPNYWSKGPGQMSSYTRPENPLRAKIPWHAISSSPMTKSMR